MEIHEVNWEQYKQVFDAPYLVFNKAEFANLNCSKCDKVYYLIFYQDSKPRGGIFGGIRNNVFLSPFSAPFGGFVFLKEDIKIQYLEEFSQLLINWAKEKMLNGIRIVLPPEFYHESFVAKQVNALIRNNFRIKYIDLNYQFDLDKFDDFYIDSIWYNAKKNLKRSFASELTFRQVIAEDEKAAAYDVIRQNRNARGFPLKMTWKDVDETSKIIESDFFIVSNNQNESIASAIVFKVKKDILQVIYWGDLPQYSDLKTMNFISYSVLKHYKNIGAKLIDIGPSTEFGLPNYGLCEFKESIGCKISSKYTFEIEF